eukprot:CAMPEP_0201539126 /NCGR_PEP_ID=MMETSP0161_2-20130828/69525_1 /ASSEMBLY_ACC=CAM_ASM_000251 /TAXON_ID=180227 /ORGANISM="Neoparamoeba aestuarina, Strain SoJaBio B1-5/56/2" /LENGTH=323 /DNA_ID=CAMNT_0047946329 /DNA_START=379 /DNA_END=1350 /DNA_ORIENTATION=+
MGEVIFPYIFVHHIIDLLVHFIRRFFPGLPQHLHLFLLWMFSIDQESYERHPVGFFEKGQVEFTCSSWQWVGPGQQMAVPHPSYFSAFATLSELSPALENKIDQFRDELVFRKVMLRRGGKGEGGWWREGDHVKRVLMKTHSSDSIIHLAQRYPEAQFVFGHRTPSKQLSSCFGLFDSAAKSRLGKNTNVLTPEWIKTRMIWLEKMWEAELDIFEDAIPVECHYQRKRKEGGVAKHNRLSIPFDRFIKGFDEVMEDIFHFLLGEGCFEGERGQFLRKALEEHGVKHRAYKKGRSYTNPSLEELGLDGEEIDKKYETYIRTFMK